MKTARKYLQQDLKSLVYLAYQKVDWKQLKMISSCIRRKYHLQNGSLRREQCSMKKSQENYN